MPEEELLGGRSNRRKFKQIGAALHEMCQPLTTLQCTLEMAGQNDTLGEYREATETGLAECRRLVALVELLREVLHQASQETEVKESGERGAEDRKPQ
jgi:signal transduction histidine kinase